MMLLGLIWAMLAPLLLLIPVWLVFRALDIHHWLDRRLPAWSPSRLRVLRAVLAAALVLAPVVTIWTLDHQTFAQFCREHGQPVTIRTAKADGFFLDDGTANSFGMRYLQSEGFQWMEARSIYQRDEFVRYQRQPDGTISETPQATKTARYEVVGKHTELDAYTSITSTRIIDTQAPVDSQEMARASLMHFKGGRMTVLLGAYGSDSCPSVLTDSHNWKEAYYLVRNTLGTRP